MVTIDPSGLPVGVHYGTITLTSDAAENDPVEVLVVLEVTGYAVRLPAIFH